MTQMRRDPTELVSVVFGPLHYGIENLSDGVT